MWNDITDCVLFICIAVVVCFLISGISEYQSDKLYNERWSQCSKIVINEDGTKIYTVR